MLDVDVVVDAGVEIGHGGGGLWGAQEVARAGALTRRPVRQTPSLPLPLADGGGRTQSATGATFRPGQKRWALARYLLARRHLMKGAGKYLQIADPHGPADEKPANDGD
uniref:Uncharacterized protein n=1 Tax=Plectus sambesii TaxID=2011161 RepID=A0A914V071_9BILA